jgi:cytochrome P450
MVSIRSSGQAARLPDGPGGAQAVGLQASFLRDPLAALTRVHREFGDLVTLRVNGRRVVAAFGAAHVRAVTDAYGREVEITTAGGLDLKPLRNSLQGRGPLNSTGTEHALYRTVCFRALGGESARSYGAYAAEMTTRMLDSWQPGMVLDLVATISGLTDRIFRSYMFGADLAATDPELDATVDLSVSTVDSPVRHLAAALLPLDVPGLARGATLRQRLGVMDARVRAIGEGSAPTQRLSLAAATLEALDRAGASRDPALARELMLQLYFAGLTSLPATIVWTLLLLALHPAPARGLLDELAPVLAGRFPQPRDTRRLPLLDAVLNESMRLYPGAAYEFKRTAAALDLGGFHLPASFPLLLAPWVTQRSAGSFADPLSFRPERFLGGWGPHPRGAFAPWGVADRACIGKALGLIALRTVVSAIVQRYRLDLLPGQRIEPKAFRFGVRLLPHPEVRVRVARQDGETGRSVAAVAGSIVGGIPGPAAGHHQSPAREGDQP